MLYKFLVKVFKGRVHMYVCVYVCVCVYTHNFFPFLLPGAHSFLKSTCLTILEDRTWYYNSQLSFDLIIFFHIENHPKIYWFKTYFILLTIFGTGIQEGLNCVINICDVCWSKCEWGRVPRWLLHTCLLFWVFPGLSLSRWCLTLKDLTI